jgi:YggT family protein
MLAQIARYLIDAVFGFFVFMLLARFHFQWLRVSFRNQIGEFVIATTNWLVLPTRRIVPGVAGLDVPTVLLAGVLQAISLWLQTAVSGSEPSMLALATVAALDLVRYSLYILVFAVILQFLLSWINPYAPLAPVFNSVVAPFLRPIRRFVPPIANIDLSPAILFIILQILLIPLNHLGGAAATL